MYRHDAYGRLLQRRDPDSGPRYIRYNAFDEVTAVLGQDELLSSPGPLDMILTRDVLGRVTQLSEISGTSQYDWDTSTSAARGRDLVGAIHHMVRDGASGAESWTFFDSVGRPQSEEILVGGERLRADYVYDSLGRLGSIDYPSVGTTRYRARYEYATDAEGGYLRRVMGGTSTLMTVEQRDLRGRIVQDSLQSGLIERRTFDGIGRLTNMNVRRAGTGVGSFTTVMNLLYGYDLTDHVASRSDTAVARADTYAIDGLGRLTGWTRSECRGSVVSPCSPGRTLRDTSYGYDLGGDLISTSTGYFGRVPARPNESESLVADPLTPHRVATRTRRVGGLIAGTDHYAHDDGGRRIGEDVEAGTDIAITSYTGFDLPLSITAGSSTETYRYDAAGTRAGRSSPGETTTYLGELFELRRSTTSNSTVGIVHVMGEEGELASVVLTAPSGTGPATSSQTLFTHRDVLGSASVITSETGTVLERQHFEPYGGAVDMDARPSPAARATALNDGFTGHELDRLTGYVNARGRMYDPRTRRFLSPDPLVGWGGSQSWNPYGYVEGSPTSFTDPSGFYRSSPTSGGWAGQQGSTPVTGRGPPRTGATTGSAHDAPIALTSTAPHHIVDDASAGVGSGAQARQASVFDRLGFTPMQLRAGVERLAAEWDRVTGGRGSTSRFPTETALAVAEGLAFGLACGAVPGCGAAMDLQTLNDPSAAWWELGLATVSLVVAAITFEEAPNFGPFRRLWSATEATGGRVAVEAASSTGNTLGLFTRARGNPRARIVRTIARGERLENIAHELAALQRATGNEHALLSLERGAGTRSRVVIVAGDTTEIHFAHLRPRRLLAHTHPLGANGRAARWFSPADVRTLRGYRQRSSYLVYETPSGGFGFDRIWLP